jgi:hypothetical protein
VAPASLGVDYHAEFESHYYSAPRGIRGEELWLRVTTTTIDMFRLGRCEAAHVQSYVFGRRTTVAAPMSVAHEHHAE